jgi:hypothetical protein
MGEVEVGDRVGEMRVDRPPPPQHTQPPARVTTPPPPGALDEVAPVAGQLVEVGLLGVLEHGGDEAAVGHGHGEGDVDVGVVGDAGAVGGAAWGAIWVGWGGGWVS